MGLLDGDGLLGALGFGGNNAPASGNSAPSSSLLGYGGNPPGGGLLGGGNPQLLGLIAGLGQASAPSRLPVPLGVALGGAAQGLLGGAEAGQNYALRAQQIQQTQIANTLTMLRLRDVASRHPDWFGLGTAGSGTPTSGQPSTASGAGLLNPGGSGTSAQSQNPGAGLLNPGGVGGGTSGPSLPPVLAGTTVPPLRSMQDAQDFLFLHPDAKDLIPKLAIGGDRPGVPPQYYNFSTGRYEADLSALPAMEAAQYAAAHGKSQGELGAKESEAAFQAGLNTRVANETEKLKTFYQTGIRPPDYNASAGPGGTAGTGLPIVQSSTGDIATPKGTVVPAAPPPPPYQGTDAIIKQNTNTQEREKNFGDIRGTLDGTEARMVGLAKALQTVQSGGLNEKRADLANNLRGLGMGSVADVIMSGKDTAAVQTALGLQTLDVLGQLKQINQGTGGRILNSEFTNLIDKQYGPDLSPQANYDLITQALGGVYQTRNMIDDYSKYGKPSGWRDANAFQSAYYSNPANSYQSMVDQAGKTIGPLKGMAGNTGASGARSNSATPFDNDARAMTIRDNYSKGMYGKVGTPEAMAAAERAYKAVGQ